MPDRIPLDSPLWDQVPAYRSTENALDRLRTVVSTRQLGEAWQSLKEEMLVGGDLAEFGRAAIPHLLDVVPHLPLRDRWRVRTLVQAMIAFDAAVYPAEPAPGLQDGLTAALRAAVAPAVNDFLADTEMEEFDALPAVVSCVAFAGHRVGRTMPYMSPGAADGFCSGCRTGIGIEGFVDPFSPPHAAPGYVATGGEAGPWRPVVEAIDRIDRAGLLGPGWSPFLRTAGSVAADGVPPDAPGPAVWCLVAAMLAAVGASSWARTVARLTGSVRCDDCGNVWEIADLVADDPDARPVTPPFTADSTHGFLPSPGWTPRTVDVPVRERWRVHSGPVDALALVPGVPPVVVAGTAEALTAWNLDSGAPTVPGVRGAVTALAPAAVPGPGHVVAVATGLGGLRWWDPASGTWIGRTWFGPAQVRTLATVTMPSSPWPLTDTWLESACDGRTVVATGDSDGGVRLWDARTRTALPELFRRAGHPVVAMSTADKVSDKRSDGAHLVVLYGDLTADAWWTDTPHVARSTYVSADELAAAGHRNLVAAAASPVPYWWRRFTVLADRDGALTRWQPYGTRLDRLPADPAHGPVVGVVVLTGSDGDPVVVTAGRAGLRVWYPHGGAVGTVALDVRPRCLLAAGDTVVVGHDTGLLALALG